MGSLSIWHWLIVLLVIILVFGTKKLKNIGTDLGSAVRGFKEGMRDASDPKSTNSSFGPPSKLPDLDTSHSTTTSSQTVDVEAKKKL